MKPRYSFYWFGGSSYSPPEDKDKEHFQSRDAILSACIDRHQNADGKTPCVEYYPGYNDCAGYIYYGNSAITDCYPDFIVRWTGRTFRIKRA